MKRLLLLYILPLLFAINATAQTEINYNTYTILEGDARFEIVYSVSPDRIEEFTLYIKDGLEYQNCDWLHVTDSRISGSQIIISFYAEVNNSSTPRECMILNSRRQPFTVRQDYQMEFPEYNSRYHDVPVGGETLLMHYYVDPSYIYEIYTQITEMIQSQGCHWLNIVEYGITSRQTLVFKFRATANTGSTQRQCEIIDPNGYLTLQQNSPNSPPTVYNIRRGGEMYTMPGLRSRITLSGSETGVTYNFYNSGEMIGSIAGTGEALDFYVSRGGVYTAKAVRNNFTSDMRGSAEFFTYPLLDSKWWGPQPVSATLSPDGGSVQLKFTTDWTYYDNSYSGYTRLKGDVEWLTSKLNNGEVSGWDPHFKITRVIVNSGSVTITIEAGPNIYSGTKTSRFCTNANSGNYFNIRQGSGGSVLACNLLGEEKIPLGGSGTITLSNRQPQVTYQLYRDGVLCSNTLNSSNAFTDLRQYGEYRVKGSFKSSSKWMNGEFHLQPDISVCKVQGGGILAGNTPVIITLSGSQAQVTYQLLRNGGIVEERAGNGSPLTFSTTIGGTYTIRGYYGGYHVTMSGEAKVIPRHEIVSADRNYTSARTYTASNGTKSNLDVTYHDGLGYPVQSIQTNAAGTTTNGQANNIITPIYYDNMRRDNTRGYLPFVSAKSTMEFETDPFTRQNAYYSAPERFGSDESGHTYAEKVHDPSPLNRVREQYNVGAVFRRNDKKSTFGYQANVAGEVWKFTISLPAGTLARTATGYAAGTLYKTTFTNEDGTRSETFTDFQERVVLERVHDGTSNLDTYHVYDDLGRLGYVIPPEAVARWNSEPADVLVARYCYKYVHDGRGRMIERRLPGKEVEYMVYDKGDRLVLVQDGNTRAENKWIYTTYDNLNRVVAQDIVKNESMSLQDIRAWAAGTEFNARYPLSWHTANARVPTPDSRFSHVRVLSESRYGGYKYPRPGSSTREPFQCPDHLAYRDVWGGDTLLNAPDPRVAGLKVYDKIYLLEGNGETNSNYIERAYYHDYKGQVIQTVEKNHLGGISRVSLKYDFTGNILSLHESHQKAAGATADVLLKTCTYDPRGRLLSDSTRLNNTGNWAVVTYDHDKLGKLRGKTYTSGNNSINETFTYNIQGWLAKKDNSLFEMELRYFNPEFGTTPAFSGNIIEWAWKHKGPGVSTPTRNIYAFQYDKLNRLVDTKQYQGTGTSPVNNFIEKGISYDRNGNVKGVQRLANGSVTDNFNTYNYTGNLLASFKNGSTTHAYTYDLNGNCTRDGLNNVDLDYNCLNLTGKVRQGTTIKATYTWSTKGIKLGVRAPGENGKGYEYLGSLVYQYVNGKLQLESGAFSNGRIITSTSSNIPNFFVTDHLGSVRVVWDGSSNTRRNDFYAFGGRWTSSGIQAASGRYLYNGKESQESTGLKYLDYGVRMYDSRSLRWNSLDVMAEKYYSVSPYAYTLNNPILFIDREGKSADWYLNLHNGQVVNVPGNEDLFSIGYINLAGDNASVGEIEDALASRNYKYARTLGGIRADTEKQYKGWAMMQIFSPENVGMVLGLNFVGGATASSSKQFLPGMGRSGQSVWSMNPLKRGLEIEKSLGGNLPKNFPVIDKLKDGVATSIKSIDLTVGSYNNGNGLLNTLTGYINKLSSFTGGKRSDFIVKQGIDFTRKALEVAIQPGKATAQQWQQINKAIEYANSQNINFIIRFIH